MTMIFNFIVRLKKNYLINIYFMPRKNKKKVINTINALPSINENDNLTVENDNLTIENETMNNDNLTVENETMNNDNLTIENETMNNDNLTIENEENKNVFDITFYKNENERLILKTLDLENIVEELKTQIMSLQEKFETLNDKNKKMMMMNILKEHSDEIKKDIKDIKEQKQEQVENKEIKTEPITEQSNNFKNIPKTVLMRRRRLR